MIENRHSLHADVEREILLYISVRTFQKSNIKGRINNRMILKKE